MAKVKNKKRLAFIVLGVVAAMIAAFICLGLIYTNGKFNQIQMDDSMDDDILQNEDIIITPTADTYRNIIVFGVDSRENWLEDSSNSDTIVIVSINNSTKDIKMVSVYRDTYLKIPEKGYRKVNAAYLYGGYSLALSTLNQNLDLTATEYVTVNFKSVINVIDLLGGITLDITGTELKWLNGYIKELNRIHNTNVMGLSSSGTQLVNGTQAVAYARIRYTSGGDFKRTERQRIVISKIFDKVKSSGFLTIHQIADEILPQIATNLSKTELLALAKDIFSYQIVDQCGFPFDKDSHSNNKASYVFPIDLANNVTKLHSFLFDTIDYVPSVTVQTISNEIEAVRTAP